MTDAAPSWPVTCPPPPPLPASCTAAAACPPATAEPGCTPRARRRPTPEAQPSTRTGGGGPFTPHGQVQHVMQHKLKWVKHLMQRVLLYSGSAAPLCAAKAKTPAVGVWVHGMAPACPQALIQARRGQIAAASPPFGGPAPPSRHAPHELSPQAPSEVLGWPCNGRQ